MQAGVVCIFCLLISTFVTFCAPLVPDEGLRAATYGAYGVVASVALFLGIIAS